MRDPSSFHEEDVACVYPQGPVCFQTCKRPSFQGLVDAHHILGRGGKHHREIHSSILNLAWLHRDIHHGPLRDAPDQRRVYLRVALEHCLNAIGLGAYAWKERDHAYIQMIREVHPQYADLYDGIL